MKHTNKEYIEFVDQLTEKVRKTIQSEEFGYEGTHALQWILTELNSFDDPEVREYLNNYRKAES